VKRPLVAILAGSALRVALPWLNRLANFLDPEPSGPPMWEDRPYQGLHLVVPPAWVELERR
jgi:hypothetical protein